MSGRTSLSFWRWLLVVVALACVTASGAAKEPKRRPQHYGRPTSKTPASHALDWPARIALFPAWLLFEVVLRKPHAALVTAVESSDTVKKAQDTTSDGPWKELTVLPAARFDVGLKPMIGLNTHWRYHRSDLLFQVSTWGPDYLFGHAAERFEVVPKQRLSVQTSFERRQDTPYYGLGPRSAAADRARYQGNDLRVQLGYSADFWRRSHVAVGLGGRGYWFGTGSCCDELSVREAVATGRFSAPGLDQDFGAGVQRAEVVLDTRPEHATRGFALRAAAFEETSYGIGGPSRSWIRYGGSLGTSVDITGTRRILSVSMHGELVDPLRGEVPFTEQVSLGGDRYLLGYLRGRLIDRSAVIGSAEYTWPIWVFLEGVVHAAVGNVFGRHFEGLDGRTLRYSAGVGLRSTGNRYSRLEMMLALGSRPFDEGGAVDSIRFMVGTQRAP